MPRGKTAKSLALIDACYDILQEIHPATVRAVCYQLFIRKLLPSMAKTHTNRVSTQLVYAREEEIIPWEWIVDETREAERPGTWVNPESFIPAVMQSYRRDRWQMQTHCVEVWAEKGTIRGTLAPVLRDYGVTFRVMHGHASATALHEAAEESRANSSCLLVLYCGDWDPSGLHMSEVDIPERLERYGGVVDLTRVALTVDDTTSALPSFPASDKTKDPRYQWFVERYGPTCWELDALNPVRLRARVAAAIEEYIDWDAWLRCDEVEQAEQRSLRQILGTWRVVISGQASLTIGAGENPMDLSRMPQRIQRQRTRGWRKPAGAVDVTRPGRWSNKYYKVGIHGTAEECVRLFESRYEHDTAYQAAVRATLHGKILMCWCPLDAPCHADVLLRWANAPAATSEAGRSQAPRATHLDAFLAAGIL